LKETQLFHLDYNVDTEARFGIDRVRRIFDFAVAAIILILLSPTFLITAIAIKLDSPGPIFHREPQFGRNNHGIQVFKFRVETDLEYGCQRPTRIGQMLSETGINELPQLFSVLRGEMSIANLLQRFR
jgi:lipopolysaccharide/colanic/teichoic acid biosynthesis glycosyltransferase